MKKLKVKINYYDVQLQRQTRVGEILEVDDVRAEALLSHPLGIVESYEAPDSPELAFDLNPPFKELESLKNRVKTPVKSKPKSRRFGKFRKKEKTAK